MIRPRGTLLTDCVTHSIPFCIIHIRTTPLTSMFISWKRVNHVSESYIIIIINFSFDYVVWDGADKTEWNEWALCCVPAVEDWWKRWLHPLLLLIFKFGLKFPSLGNKVIRIIFKSRRLRRDVGWWVRMIEIERANGYKECCC